jgi:tetrapyrrole methylase family protein/MazG family protein
VIKNHQEEMEMKKTKLQKNPRSAEIGKEFEKLVDVLYTLRSEQGCPWDRAQTIQDLKQFLLEETYEVLQELDENNEDGLREELGDLLLEIVFMAQIMQEKNVFTLAEVLNRLNDKMIRRHPHVFGTAKAGSPDEAIANWESMKSKETGGAAPRRSLLQGVPIQLPALLQANLISTKVARVGFDWETEKDVWAKLAEEMNEFQEAKSPEHKEEELGDILLTLVNIARKNKINPEDALRKANSKFSKRFRKLEEKVESLKKDWKDLDPQRLDALWEEAKEE